MNLIKLKGTTVTINLDNIQKIVYDEKEGRVMLGFNNDNDLSNIYFEGQDAIDVMDYMEKCTFIINDLPKKEQNENLNPTGKCPGKCLT